MALPTRAYPPFSSTALITNSYDSLGRVATQFNANKKPGFDTTYISFFAGSRSEEDDPFGNKYVIYYSARQAAVRHRPAR